MLAHVRELAEAGVDAIKIEGRNKKAFYVATVVSAYRRVLDGEDPAAVAPELDAVSHRPYSTGFYFGEAEQAPAFDGYEQDCLHAADVLACEAEPSGEGEAYVLEARCRNRFEEGEALEALRPRAAVAHVTVRDLTWLPDPTDDDPSPEPQPVAVANRSGCRYRFRAEGLGEAIVPGSFLRARRYRRSARHE